MTEQDPNQQQSNATNDDVEPKPSDVTEKMSFHKSTFDLRSAADEALQMLRDAQAQEIEREASDESIAIAATDTKLTNVEKPADVGNTTYDLAKQAQEAMDMAESEKTNKRVVEFTEDMKLQIDVVDFPKSLIVDVKGEMLVGRADNVTDYIPEIDLTPHGAYRLGLSRRHATIMCHDNRLIVKDLNSRNGTFINGVAVDKGGTQELASGDELRFGNLSMRISFKHKSDN